MKEQKNIIITKRRPAQRLKQSMPYYLMLLPGMVLLFIFKYLPLMAGRLLFRNSYRPKDCSEIRNGWDFTGFNIFPNIRILSGRCVIH